MDRKSMSYTNSLQYIGKEVSVVIDRPFGSKHPKHDLTYGLNYGYIPGTVSPDGEELDAYIIGPNKPMKDFTGTCIAVIHRTNDNDDKLIVVSDKYLNVTDEEIRKMTDFQEKFFESIILRKSLNL